MYKLVELNCYTQKNNIHENNDGCNLGNYGIDSIFYGEMIVSRWLEITHGTMSKPKWFDAQDITIMS